MSHRDTDKPRRDVIDPLFAFLTMGIPGGILAGCAWWTIEFRFFELPPSGQMFVAVATALPFVPFIAALCIYFRQPRPHA